MSKPDLHCPVKGEKITTKACATSKRGSTKTMCETQRCKHLSTEKPETVNCRGDDITPKNCRKRQREAPHGCIGCLNKISEEVKPVEVVQEDEARPKLNWSSIYPATQNHLSRALDITSLEDLSKFTKQDLFDEGFKEGQVNFFGTVLSQNDMKFACPEQTTIAPTIAGEVLVEEVIQEDEAETVPEEVVPEEAEPREQLGWSNIYPATQRRLEHALDITSLEDLSKFTKQDLYAEGLREGEINFFDVVLRQNDMKFTYPEQGQRVEQNQHTDLPPVPVTSEEATIMELTKAMNRVADAMNKIADAMNKIADAMNKE